MTKAARFALLFSLVAGVALSGHSLAPTKGAAFVRTPRATLVDANGSTIGDVTFWPASQHKVFVHVNILSATPGFHGIHIHSNEQKLGCVAPAFTSVGPHFVMMGDGTHGDHTGDMPNVLVNEDGTGHLWFITDHFDLSEVKERAMIFHADADNHGHVPVSDAPTAYTPNSPEATTLTAGTGNAGARVACGVITVK